MCVAYVSMWPYAHLSGERVRQDAEAGGAGLFLHQPPLSPSQQSFEVSEFDVVPSARLEATEPLWLPLPLRAVLNTNPQQQQSKQS